MYEKCAKCGKIEKIVVELTRDELGPHGYRLPLCYDCGFEVKQFILGNHSLSETVTKETK